MTTNQEAALRELLAKGSDATLLREMIGYAAQRLMEPDTASAVRTVGCGATATASETGRPGQAPWRCVSPSCAAALAFLASWNRAGQWKALTAVIRKPASRAYPPAA